jgi:hypothetical protein
VELQIRKVVSVVETVRTEMGHPVDALRRKVATAVAADSMAHLRGRARLFVTEHVIVGE